MKHVNINTEHAFEAYGLKCRNFIPESIKEKAPFGAMKATVKPGQTSVRHMHHETEVFYLISGHGEVSSDNNTCLVEKDSVILLPAFSAHTITNLSGDEPLEFLTFWWEDKTAIKQELQSLNLPTNQNILVTATPPTPNGDLHLGHISGPYLGADIYTRFMRVQGNKVFYLTGTDVNQTYVYTKAIQQDKDPIDVAKSNTTAIKETLRNANIEYSGFYEPWNIEQYNEQIQSFFEELYQRGCCKEKVTEELFDDERYLHEAFVQGTCPHCGTSSDGNCCEKCGLPHEMTELQDSTSFYSDAPLITQSIQKLYFPLEDYRTELQEYFERLDLMAHHKLFIHQLFSKPLPDIALSHPGPWGIQHKIEGYQDQVVYVWAEMLPGYLTATRKLSGKNWCEFDKRIQFYGFDNTFYHLVLFPAMLMAMGQTDALPDGFTINEFLQLDGSKFSTSREHLIWAKDFFQDKPTDVARMYLAEVRPEQAVNNFSLQGFDSFATDYVNNKLIATITRFWQFIAQLNDNTLTAPGAWTPSCRSHYKQLKELYQTALQAHQAETFAAPAIMNSVEQMTDIAQDNCDMVEFLMHAPEEFDQVRTHLALIAMALQAISIGLVGIAPEFAQRLHHELGLGKLTTIQPELEFTAGNLQVKPDDKAYFEVR